MVTMPQSCKSDVAVNPPFDELALPLILHGTSTAHQRDKCADDDLHYWNGSESLSSRCFVCCSPWSSRVSSANCVSCSVNVRTYF
jgi:hypothetical protein